MQDDRPLSGRVALDLSQGIAGPYCGRLLAEHGARVIKVEPPGGDWIRGMGDGPGGTSVHFLYYNLGKESVVLDLKTPEGVAGALRIAAHADMVIESARPGVMERLGLGYEAVRAVRGDVLYLSVSGYGQEGPRAGEPLTDAVAQAYSGMISVNTGADGVPHKIHTTIVDALTGLYAFQAMAMALIGGGPRHIDISLMQAAAAAMGPKIMEFAHQGQTPMLLNPPAGAHRTADGWITVTLVKEAHFTALVRAIGLAEMAEDPRFADFRSRQRHEAEVVGPIAARLAERTTAAWLASFEGTGVLAGPVNDFGMWLADPQVAAAMAAPMTEVMPGAVTPVARTAGRAPFTAPAPAIGADTDRILSEFAEAP